MAIRSIAFIVGDTIGAVLALLLLVGCASQGEPKVAVCDGKHRRPANPYGSVLPSAPAPTAGAPGPQSAIDPKSFDPCGARA